MDPRDHKNVPLGILNDHEGQPRTVLLDYDTVILPSPSALLEGVRLTLEGWRQLMALGPQVEAEILACRAQMAADADDAPVAECGYCTARVTLLGGMWTCDDGTVACTDTSAPFVAHMPKEG